MVILTDRELEFLVSLGHSGERLYRDELARLLMEEAQRRGRFDIERKRHREADCRVGDRGG